MSDNQSESTENTSQSQPDAAAANSDAQEETFTRAELDRLVGKVRIEERRKAAEKYGDYDDLKAKAQGAKTAEQRLAEMETSLKEASIRALRSDVAARYGLDAADRDLFLTATDEDSLVAQAIRLAALNEAQKAPRTPKPNPAQREGTAPADDQDAIARAFFGIK